MYKILLIVLLPALSLLAQSETDGFYRGRPVSYTGFDCTVTRLAWGVAAPSHPNVCRLQASISFADPPRDTPSLVFIGRDKSGAVIDNFSVTPFSCDEHYNNRHPFCGVEIRSEELQVKEKISGKEAMFYVDFTIDPKVVNLKLVDIYADGKSYSYDLAPGLSVVLPRKRTYNARMKHATECLLEEATELVPQGSENDEGIKPPTPPEKKVAKPAPEEEKPAEEKITTVKIKRATTFRMTRNGKVVARSRMDAGTVAEIKSIDGKEMTIAVGLAEATVPISNTDYEEQLAAQKAKAKE